VLITRLVLKRFEVDDINLGIEHFYGQFDVVHCRLISPGVSTVSSSIGFAHLCPVQISDYSLLIDQIARVLRPGGLMILGESDCIIYDQDHRPIPAPLDAAGPPWWPRWMTHLRSAIEQRGGSIGAARNLLRWVRDHGSFVNMSYQDVWLPAVAGPDDDYEDPIYSHMKDDVLVRQADSCCRTNELIRVSRLSFDRGGLYYSREGFLKKRSLGWKTMPSVSYMSRKDQCSAVSLGCGLFVQTTIHCNWNEAHGGIQNIHALNIDWIIIICFAVLEMVMVARDEQLPSYTRCRGRDKK
jgi:hypothetical protein